MLKAMTMAAWTWQWNNLALLLLVGYAALLRPIELCSLRRSDFVLSSDHGNGPFILVKLPIVLKTRWVGARARYARIDVEPYRTTIEMLLQPLDGCVRLRPGPPNTFYLRFCRLVQRLFQHPDLVSPASLRTGGASWLFQLWNEDVSRLAWRGRCLGPMRTPVHYIQELSSHQVSLSMSSDVLAKVTTLSALFDDYVAAALNGH